MLPSRCFPAAAVLTVAIALVQPVGGAEADFVKILNEKDLTGLKLFPENAADTFKVEDGVIKVSGKPNGYFYTEKSYKNFVLRFDWRYPEKAGNSGLLVYIQPPHRVFPRCIEVQRAYGGHGSIFAIGGAKGKFKDDGAARKKALKDAREWHTTEVTSMNGKLTAKINGTLVCEGEAEGIHEDPLGWQSEGAPIEFKNIILQELK
ncbi:MAG: DUF1080 domain-containing protein [Planctomycetia bacterium]|nr:DUF1080 domain-containing protein [Planctomycetia bacterium]